MTIVRGPQPSDNFALIANAMLQDESLSYRARGVLASILSRPPGWSTNSTLLAEQGAEGRDAVRTVLAELEQAGYMRRTKERTAEGKFISITEVAMSRILEPVAVSEPAPENPALEDQAVTTKTDHKERSSSSPVVSPEAREDEKISDDEEVVAEPPVKAEPLKQSDIISPPARLDLLPEHYKHREFMPDAEAIAEIRERFAEHDLSKEVLRGQTNAYIKWIGDLGDTSKIPHSYGWRVWMIRFYRRIIDENLKALGINVESYSPGELTQEEREAQRNDLDTASQRQESGPDESER